MAKNREIVYRFRAWMCGCANFYEPEQQAERLYESKPPADQCHQMADCGYYDITAKKQVEVST
jgi:hypothetical protein